MKLRSASVALALLAAACAAPPAPPQPPKPVFTPDMIDGLYRGTSTRYQADSRSCPSPGLVTLHVTGGQFEYRWKYKVMVPATINQDGYVQGQLEDITLTGQVLPATQAQGGDPALPQRIQGDVTNGVCSVHYTVVKRAGPPAQ